ncbi:hypothetical protein BESB_077560 [Besnoitia besnoiti]|uniref:Trichohyalin-plectin-homology domain-containing protein n=1 Tax=Besnoitia besnoiti TaxID=94643 RepID=A0A2A9M6G2_BESBE|nr:hypothetical protein BESB_077560 [Besnoitia besnoiti]PFH33539.1 hypothetical protein BESB_077560 [Besnoitia besnoiti]
MAAYRGHVPEVSLTSGVSLAFHGKCGQPDLKAQQQRESVLTEADIRKIKELLSGDTTSPRKAADAEKRRQDHAQSMKRVQKWANTVHSNLAKRRQLNAKRLADEEAARVVADEAEAVLKHQRRLEVVRRAKAMLAADNERQRALKTALMRRDWLEGLQEQKKWKQQLAQLDAVREAHFGAVLAHAESQKEARDTRDHEEKNTKMKELQAGRQLQFSEAHQRRAREKEEREEMGKLIRENCRRDRELIEAQEEQKRLKHREQQRAMMRQLDEAIRLDRHRRESERLEEEAAMSQAAVYEKRQAMVKERETHLRQEEAKARETRIQDMSRRLEKLLAEEAQRLTRDVEIQQAKEAARADAEKQKREEQYRLMAQDRAAQVERKREHAQRQREADADLTRSHLEASKREEEKELRTAEERKRAMRDVAEIQKQQMFEKKQQRLQERNEEKRTFNEAFKELVQQEESVDALAAHCVENAIQAGQSPDPIVATMNRFLITSGARPSRKASQMKSSNIFNLHVGPSDSEEESLRR